MMNSESHLKRKSRTLSRFLCQEMMYDFVTDHLNEDRKQAMIDFINQSEDTQEDLEAFQQAMNYCEQLTHLTPTEPLIDKIKSQSSLSKKLFLVFSWNNWPQPLKWTLQGVFVSLLAASFAIFVPWEKFQINLDLKSKGSPLYVAKKQETKNSDALIASNELKKQNNNSTEPTQSSDNEAKKQTIDTSESAKTSETAQSDSKDTVNIDTEKQTKESEESAKAVESKKVVSKSRSAVVKSNLKGSLTRMYMTVKDFKEFSRVVEDFITSVGGQKAGQVELGWEKNKNTRYFHFTIPEKDYSDLMQLLRTKADTKVMRTPHSRVMPEGKMRLILEISGDD